MSKGNRTHRFAWAAILIGSLLEVAAVVLSIAAIWVVGPNSGRLAGTAGVLFVVGFLAVFFGGLELDLD